MQIQITKTCKCPLTWAFAFTVEDGMKNNLFNSKVRLAIFTVILLIVSVICIFESKNYNYTEEVVPTTETETTVEEIEFIQEEEVQAVSLVCNNTDILSKSSQPMMLIEEDDEYLLAKLAMAEAEGEDVEGKVLVICVVLNRVLSDDFPDTVSEVIYQQLSNGVHQFSPIGNGRFDSVEPDDDCWRALSYVEAGYDNSLGALYFTSSKEQSTWHSRNLEFLFEHGGHKFYK